MSKTEDLLLKVRKGATAGLGPNHWITVLQELGFSCAETREGRKLDRVMVTAPNGESVEVIRDPRYKAISFTFFHLPMEGHLEVKRDDGPPSCSCGKLNWPCYETPFTSIEKWAAEQGLPLADLAAQALGIHTIAEERAIRDYKARDWTHTGTCGVCAQNVKMEAGGERQVLVLHGYQRPGDGQTYGQCFGRGYLPHELAPDAARAFLEKVLIPHLDSLRRYLSNLQTGLVKELCVVKSDPRSKRLPVYMKEGEQGWDRALTNEITITDGGLRSVQREVDRFTTKVAEWKLDVLPEVKMAKLFAAG